MDIFANSILTKETRNALPSSLILDEKYITKSYNKAYMKTLPKNKQMAYLFYFSVQKTDIVSNEARKEILRLIYFEDVDENTKELAKQAFYYFFNGFLESKVKNYYKNYNAYDRADKIDEGVSELWVTVYERLPDYFKRDKIAEISVTTYFGKYAESYLTDKECRESVSGVKNRGNANNDKLVNDFVKQFKETYLREPTLTEITDALGFSVNKVNTSMERLSRKNMSSLNIVTEEDDDTDVLNNAQIYDADNKNVPYDTPEDDYIKKERSINLRKALNALNKQELQIFLRVNHMTLEGNEFIEDDITRKKEDIRASFSRVARELKLKTDDVSDIYSQTLRTLRNAYNVIIGDEKVKAEDFKSNLYYFDKEKNNSWEELLADMGISEFMEEA